MARASGHSQSTIGRMWRAFGLQPHRSETFKLSTDPLFVEKVRDVVGLYPSCAATPGSESMIGSGWPHADDPAQCDQPALGRVPRGGPPG
jgi:hypothetical protein